MPLYEYKCECGNRFEDLNSIANRHRAECIHCGKMADKVQTPINIDPNADLPGAHLKWQKAAGRRGRGTDMTAANKTVTEDRKSVV